jgi:bifunctional DNA-binding transcriptional regulator/antitoxin component of YhaV-PrlF toxin-antitoxin module
MILTIKPKSEITVPKSILRKAGFRPGDRVEFRVSGQSISIVLKLRPDEIQKEQQRPSPAALAKFRKILRLVQEDAKRAGLDKITMRQINAEIAAMRRARAKKNVSIGEGLASSPYAPGLTVRLATSAHRNRSNPNPGRKVLTRGVVRA